MDVCLLWVLSGRGLCDGLITRPEESYRLWCVVVCDLETSWMRKPWPTGGLLRQKNYMIMIYLSTAIGLTPSGSVNTRWQCCKVRSWSSPYNRTRRPIFGVEVKLYSFFNLDDGWGWWSTSHPSRFFPRERLGTHCIGGWVGPRAGPDGCGKGPATGIRSAYRPTRSESLYRLKYRGLICTGYQNVILKMREPLF